MPEGYFENPRNDVLGFLSQLRNKDISYNKVLDLGCASGVFGINLKNRFNLKNFDWTGIELRQDLPNAKFNYSLLGRCIHQELPYCLYDLKRNYFDCIFALDVLEHLADPIEVINILRDKINLNGKLIISIPNICHYSIIFSLFQQKWNYEEYGILDKTHLRFYTPSSFHNVLKENGWEVEKIEPINSYDGIKGFLFEIIKKLFPKFLVNFFAYGHIFKLKKNKSL